MSEIAKCQMHLCAQAALDNGYCVEHQSAASRPPSLHRTAPVVPRPNPVERALWTTACIMIFLGFVAGTLFGLYTMSWMVFFSYTISFVVVGVILIGLAEIIRLLQQLVHNSNKIINNKDS